MSTLGDYHWLSVVGAHSKEECGVACADLAHHVGCLLTHLRVWDRFLKSDAENFVLWEKDGAKLNSVSPLDYNELAEKVPENADLVWMKPNAEASGQFLKRFKSQGQGTWSALEDGEGALQHFDEEQDVYLYEFNKRCSWAGTSSYMMTRRGAEKIQKFIRESKQVDMIDGWLATQCGTRCDDETLCMNLNCYIAQTKPVPEEVLGGYVPEWYGETDDEPEREVDAAIVEEMADARKYNDAGCQRSGYKGWVPVGFYGASDICDPQAIRRCLDPSQVDFCDPSVHFPMKDASLEISPEACS
jgi:hypothetical protein